MSAALAPSKDKEGLPSLTLVSNRLPITLKRTDAGGFDLTVSSGGLVTGISGVAKEVNFTWYGNPGMEVAPSERKELEKKLMESCGGVPVFHVDGEHEHCEHVQQQRSARSLPQARARCLR